MKQHCDFYQTNSSTKRSPLTEYCDVLLSGQVYRLRNPSARYLASLSIYDSANPTKDWEFPQLSSNRNGTHAFKFGDGTPASNEIPLEKSLFMSPSQLSASKVNTLILTSNN